jgi:NADPH:quinone reductase-like Zn-dependent oxidoreductase
MGGQRSTEIDAGMLLTKRAQIIGSTLRARPASEKATIVSRFLERFGADLEDGRIRPVIEAVLPVEQADEAHRRMDSGDHFGKIVLRVAAA